MDVFIGSPEASSKVFLCLMGDAKLWQLNRTVGPTAAVEDTTSLLTDTSYDQLSVSDRSYDARQYTDVLEREPGRSLIYNYFDKFVAVSERLECSADEFERASHCVLWFKSGIHVYDVVELAEAHAIDGRAPDHSVNLDQNQVGFLRLLIRERV